MLVLIASQSDLQIENSQLKAQMQLMSAGHQVDAQRRDQALEISAQLAVVQTVSAASYITKFCWGGRILAEHPWFGTCVQFFRRRLGVDFTGDLRDDVSTLRVQLNRQEREWKGRTFCVVT